MTEEQTAASTLLWQPEVSAVQLVAGAGSGKTTTLIETVLQGVKSGFPPEQICLITFTRKAAAEMNHRLQERDVSPGFTGTMHSLGFKIIQSYFSNRGLKSPQILRNQGILFKESAIEVLSDHCHIPVKILTDPRSLPPETLEAVRENYTSRKNKLNAMDLDDLISMASELLLKEPGDFQYRYVLVDEFQDTSPDQLAFIKAMRPEKIFAVGDDWQSIYAFRGADVSAAVQFDTHFNNSNRLFLTRNFRSQKTIVGLGNRAIRLSSTYIRKKLKAVHKKINKPVCHIVNFSTDIETVWKSFLKSRPSDKADNLTVLVRTNFIRLKLKASAPPGIEVLTIHSSKGMEFDNVLVFGIAKNVFPHRWNDYDEEVRLLYVAITRAKKNLEFVSWEDNNNYSPFMPFLAANCKISYLPASAHDQEPTG